jgi:hypothetical protein
VVLAVEVAAVPWSWKGSRAALSSLEVVVQGAVAAIAPWS